MVKKIFKLSYLILGLTFTLQLIMIFVLVWVNGKCWMDEPNLVIRTFESFLLVFGAAGLGYAIIKEVWKKKER